MSSIPLNQSPTNLGRPGEAGEVVTVQYAFIGSDGGFYTTGFGEEGRKLLEERLRANPARKPIKRLIHSWERAPEVG